MTVSTKTMNATEMVVATGYCNNTYDRRNTCSKWAELLDAMPIGQPMQAKEVCEIVNKARYEQAKAYYESQGWTGCWYNKAASQSVYQLFHALAEYGTIAREVVPCEPYTIKIGVGDQEYINGEYVFTKFKDKVIDTVTLYTRLK